MLSWLANHEAPMGVFRVFFSMPVPNRTVQVQSLLRPLPLPLRLRLQLPR